MLHRERSLAVGIMLFDLIIGYAVIVSYLVVKVIASTIFVGTAIY